MACLKVSVYILGVLLDHGNADQTLTLWDEEVARHMVTEIIFADVGVTPPPHSQS